MVGFCSGSVAPCSLSRLWLAPNHRVYPYRPRQLNHARRVAIRPRHWTIEAALSLGGFFLRRDRGRVLGHSSWVHGRFVFCDYSTIVISGLSFVTIPFAATSAPRKRRIKSANSSSAACNSARQRAIDAFNHENCVAGIVGELPVRCPSRQLKHRHNGLLRRSNKARLAGWGVFLFANGKERLASPLHRFPSGSRLQKRHCFLRQRAGRVLQRNGIVNVDRWGD